MNRISRLFLILFCLVIFPLSVVAQSTTSDVNTRSTMDSLVTKNTAGPAWLSVTTNQPGASVFLDTLFLGATPLTHVAVKPGNYTLKVLAHNSTQWEQPSIVKEITIAGGDTLSFSFEFPYSYFITSEPFGAAVMQNDSTLGTTPLRLMRLAPLSDALLLRKSGYEDATLDIRQWQGNSITLQLHPKDNVPVESAVVLNNGGKEGTTAHVYIVAGAGLLSGIASAYFKRQADKFFSDYQSNNKSSLLDDTRRYDRYAAITLALFEISFAALTYFLLSD
jgi:hypothetical protein